MKVFSKEALMRHGRSLQCHWFVKSLSFNDVMIFRFGVVVFLQRQAVLLNWGGGAGEGTTD